MFVRATIQSGIALLLLAGCGGTSAPAPTPNDSNILVKLSGLPARAVSVVVSATLDGKAAMASDTYAPPPADGQFGISLPPTVSGTLKLNVDALDIDGCSQAAGTLSATLPNPQRLDAALTLGAKVPRQCGALSPCAANTICPDTVPFAQAIRGLWTIAPTDIWAVGDGGLLAHYDGSSWIVNKAVTTSDLKGVWASGPSDVWAVGANGTVLHYSSGTWTATGVGTKDLKGIWGSSPTEIWAGGEINGGTAILRHYNGATWQSVNTGLSASSVNGIYTSAPDFIYGCGLDTFGGLLFRWNGSNWSKVASTVADELRAFWGSGRTNLVAVGDYGSMARYDDGIGWTYVNTTNNTAHLYAATADSQKTVYAVGDNGTIYRIPAPYQASGLTIYNSTAKALRAISFGANGIGWAGGTLGFLGHMDLRP